MANTVAKKVKAEAATVKFKELAREEGRPEQVVSNIAKALDADVGDVVLWATTLSTQAGIVGREDNIGEPDLKAILDTLPLIVNACQPTYAVPSRGINGFTLLLCCPNQGIVWRSRGHQFLSTYDLEQVARRLKRASAPGLLHKSSHSTVQGAATGDDLFECIVGGAVVLVNVCKPNYVAPLGGERLHYFCRVNVSTDSLEVVVSAVERKLKQVASALSSDSILQCSTVATQAGIVGSKDGIGKPVLKAILDTIPWFVNAISPTMKPCARWVACAVPCKDRWEMQVYAR